MAWRLPIQHWARNQDAKNDSSTCWQTTRKSYPFPLGHGDDPNELRRAAGGPYDLSAKPWNSFHVNVPLTVRYAEALLRSAKQKRPTGPARPAEPGATDTGTNTADRPGCQRSRGHGRFVLLHGGIPRHERQLTTCTRAIKAGTVDPGLDSVQRARYTARMEQFQEYLLAAEERK